MRLLDKLIPNGPALGATDASCASIMSSRDETNNLHPLSNKRDGSSNLLVNNKSKNSHHSSTSLVELVSSTLSKLGLLIEGVTFEVKQSLLVTEVTNELSSGDVLVHYEELKEFYESNNLEKSSLGDWSNSSPTVRDGVEGSSRVVELVSGYVIP